MSLPAAPLAWAQAGAATLDAASRMPRAPGTGWVPAGSPPPLHRSYETDMSPSPLPTASRAAALPRMAGATIAPPGAMRTGFAPETSVSSFTLAPPGGGTFSRGGAALGPGAGVGAQFGVHVGDGSLLAGTATEQSRAPATPPSGPISPVPRASSLSSAVAAPAQQGVGSFDRRAPLTAPLPDDSLADVAQQIRPAPLGGARNPMATELSPTEDPSAPSPELPSDRPRPPRPGKPPKTAPDAAQRGKGGGGIAAYAGAARAASAAAEAVPDVSGLRADAASFRNRASAARSGALEADRAATRAGTAAADVMRARIDKNNAEIATARHTIQRLESVLDDRTTPADKRAEIGSRLDAARATLEAKQAANAPLEPVQRVVELRIEMNASGLSETQRAALVREYEAANAKLNSEQRKQAQASYVAGERNAEAEKADRAADAAEAELVGAEASEKTARAAAQEALLRKEQALAGLARQLGLDIEHVRKKLESDPDSSLAKRVAEEEYRQDVLAWDEAHRAERREVRRRHGAERARAEAMLVSARSARDRATAGAAELSRIRRTRGVPASVVSNYSLAVKLASSLAKDAKAAAKAAKRLAQYGTDVKGALTNVLDAADAAAKLSAAASDALDLFAKAERVAAHPDASPAVQQVVQEKANAAANLAIAEVEAAAAGYPPDRPPEWLKAARIADGKAKAAFYAGIADGTIDPDLHTTSPDCPPNTVRPPGCFKCMPWEAPWFSWWGPDDKPWCDKSGAVAEPAGGKGKGPVAPPGSEHETSDEVTPKDPPPPAPPPKRYADPPKSFVWFSEDGEYLGTGPEAPPQVAGQETGGRPAKAPESSPAADGRPAVGRAPDAPPSQKENRDDQIRRVAAAAVRDRVDQAVREEYVGFMQEMLDRARDADAAGGRTSNGSKWESFVFEAGANSDHADALLKLSGTRLLNKKYLERVDAELADDPSAARRAELERQRADLDFSIAIQTVQMVELAGARQIPASDGDAVRAVEKAVAADRAYAGVPGFESGSNLKLLLKMDSTVEVGLSRAKDRGLPGAVAAARAWNDAKPGIGDFLRDTWIGMTGGPDAKPWQRALILAGTLAIGVATGGAGAGLAAFATRSIAQAGVKAVVNLAIRGTASGIASVASSALSKAVVHGVDAVEQTTWDEWARDGISGLLGGLASQGLLGKLPVAASLGGKVVRAASIGFASGTAADLATQGFEVAIGERESVELGQSLRAGVGGAGFAAGVEPLAPVVKRGFDEFKSGLAELGRPGAVTPGEVYPGGRALGVVASASARGVRGLIDGLKTVAMTPEGAAEPAGGVYVLRDLQTGEVLKTGRSGNLARREGEHHRNPEYPPHEFESVFRTKSRNARRGLEQMLHEQYDPPLDRINAIAPDNPNKRAYMRAAREFLRRHEQ